MFRALPLERIKPPVAVDTSDWTLSQAEVLARREQYGNNDVIEKTKRQWLVLLRDTLLDPMIWFLVAASLLFAMLGKTSNAIILLLATIPIGGMDAYLHWRTQVSTQSLKTRLLTHARVLRDNKEWLVPTQDLVPGDLVIVSAAEYFPADGIIVKSENAQVDESSLSGEAFPIAKKALMHLPKDQTNPLIPYLNWGFVGTRLLTGKVLLRVVYTGKETIYGEIIQSVLQTEHANTPLQNALARLVGILIIIASIFCIILAVVRYWQGFGLVDALLSAATLAVVALPDEFPMTFTFFLGVGVYRLAQAHALVRRAVSVENIGRVTSICTDKTGTLTTGIFRVAKAIPVKTVTKEDLLFQAKLAARIDSGDPLDEAIYAASPDNQTLIEYLQVYPFTEERKRETVIINNAGQIYAVCKGAPENILSLCDLTAKEKQDWQEQILAQAEQGFKVIACASLNLQEWQKNSPEPEAHYQFSGLLVFEDPPRPEVFAAIDYCQRSKIQVVMITGDHPETAKKIAMDIGIGSGNPKVMTAVEAEKLIKQNDLAALRQIDVIARAVPAQKYAVVKALQQMKDIVAVTGDGVNDVPALRAADVGIAMGERGTQSAREAASIVLLDDNFGSIINAIREGKQLFKNLQASFKYLLMVHTPYVISATIIPLLGYPLLYYPIHIVWIELFIHPTCMLVFQDLPERAEMPAKQNRKQPLSFFSSYDWWGIVLMGCYTTLMVIMTYLISLDTSGSAAVARANAFIAVGLVHIALTIGLSRLNSLTARVIVALSILMLVLLVQIPFIAEYFAMQPPSLMTWQTLIIANLVTVFLASQWR